MSLLLSTHIKYLKGIGPVKARTLSEDLKISPALPGDLLQDAFSVARAGYEILKQESFDASQYGGSALSPTYLRLSQAERERMEKQKNT